MVSVTVRGRVPGEDGIVLERLVCHPSLPLAAGLDAARPAVHVWDFSGDAPYLAATIGGDGEPYPAQAWDRDVYPHVAWHPSRPELFAAIGGPVLRWSPGSPATVVELPDEPDYRYVAVSPGGRTLWAFPSQEKEGRLDHASDAIDLVTGQRRAARGWDTAVAAHPGGELALTLRSNQGATLGVFSRIDESAAPATLRPLRTALILDADGYEAPCFSRDGRYFAIRGNAYEAAVWVFAFPSLEGVTVIPFSDPSPGYPYPEEWLAQVRAWSPHSVAFGAHPGRLWIGTPHGTLVEVDLPAEDAQAHDVLSGACVTALCVTASGDLLVATADGALTLLAVEPVPEGLAAQAAEAAREVAQAFLAGTPELPADGELEDLLVRTDGTGIWAADDLEEITEAPDDAPTWLRLQAAINQVAATQAPEN